MTGTKPAPGPHQRPLRAGPLSFLIALALDTDARPRVAYADGPPQPTSTSAPLADPAAPVEPLALPPTGVLEGRVLGKGDRTPLPGATVSIDGASVATTDEEGRFRVASLTPGKHVVRVAVAGAGSMEIRETILAGKPRRATYYLLVKVAYQSTVKAAHLAPHAAEVSLDAAEAQRVPGTRGDALQAVQSLPGVARAPFGTGQLVVWGSSPRDTRVYANGVAIPTLFHFGGLRSTVNGEVIAGLTFTGGGYGAEHGRGLGGLVEIDTRAPRTDGYHGFVQLDALDGSFLVEGPITRTLSFGVSARRSWIDLVLPYVTGNSLQLSPQYTDYQLRLRWTPTRRDTVDLVGLGSDDSLSLLARDPDPQLAATVSSHTFYHQLQLRWVHRFDDGGVLTVTPSAGYTSPQSLSARLGAVGFTDETTTVPYGLRALYRRPLAPFARLDVGLDAEGARHAIHQEAPIGGGRYVGGSGEIFVHGVAPFVGVQLTGAGGRLTLDTQARLEALLLDGSARFPSVPGHEASSFSSRFLRPEVRLAARYQALPWLALKAAYGNYDQPPDPRALFGPAGNPQLGPESAQHLVAGVELRPTPTLTIAINAFWKTPSRLVVPASTAGAPPLSNEGVGRVIGGELLVRQELWKNFFGWISYTLSRAERQDHAGEPWHLLAYDQTHILNVVASYRLPRGFQLGLRFRYVTGNPVTPIAGSYGDLNSGRQVLYPGAPSSARLDAFHQLDLRLDKTWTYDRWRLSLYVDLQNVYNAQNPELYQYSWDGTKRAAVAGFPFLPVVGLRGDF